MFLGLILMNHWEIHIFCLGCSDKLRKAQKWKILFIKKSSYLSYASIIHLGSRCSRRLHPPWMSSWPRCTSFGGPAVQTWERGILCKALTATQRAGSQVWRGRTPHGYLEDVRRKNDEGILFKHPFSWQEFSVIVHGFNAPVSRVSAIVKLFLNVLCLDYLV